MEDGSAGEQLIRIIDDLQKRTVSFKFLTGRLGEHRYNHLQRVFALWDSCGISRI